MTPAPEAPLCVLSVHAHPDDEASKGAATMARYHDEGVRTVLVCCTGGEEGEILNPAADTPEARTDLHAVRMRELEESVRVIGYDALHLLGYRDSGMPDSEANARPDNFANADLDEAAGRLVEIVRAERPQVIVTYALDTRYVHPDHIRVHDVSVLAFDRAGDPEWYPDLGEPWQPSKLYYTAGFSVRRVRTIHQWLVDHDEESPFAEWIDELPPDDDDPITTRVDVRDYLTVGRDALLAHRTQVGPDSVWFRMPLEETAALFPCEEYVLARNLVSGERETGEPVEEWDLFDGLRPSIGIAQPRE